MGLLGAFVELIFDIVDDIERLGNWLRANPIAGLGLLFLVIFFGWFVDRWFADSEIFTANFWESRGPEGIRNLVWAMATVFAGAAGLYGLLLAGRRTAALDRQAQIAHAHRELAEQGQITERFTKAVEQLGHAEVAVRLGAIYALERIAKDSERDFVTIMETLAAFVRERAPCQLRDASDDREEDGSQFENTKVPDIDIVAAVSVLARSTPLNSPIRVGRVTERVDLRNVDLRGLDLPGAVFSGFRFDGSNLSFAVLEDADLNGASLERARCIGTNLMSAKICRATFRRVLLDRASLEYVECKETSFREAKILRASASITEFESSDFSSARLEGFDVAVIEFSDCNFDGADFSNSHFYSATFEGCKLTECYFDGAHLSKVVFHRCDLSNSGFGSAEFDDPERPDRSAFGCEFKESDLSSVDMSDTAGLTEEHLAGAFYRNGKTRPLLPEEVGEVVFHRLD